jgi:stearoyl-CoA desaturase (delta-9 desaturase)
MIKYTMLALKMMYIVIFGLFLVMPFVNLNLWLQGIAFGWVFHWIVGSIIIHRYITHKTFKVNRVTHHIFTLLSTIAYAGSSLAWASMHRVHHTASDMEKDPHSPKKYKWWELLSLSVNLENKNIELLNCKDLLNDKVHLFCHKYYVSINVAFVVFLWALSPYMLAVFWIGIAYHVIGIFFSTYVYHNKLPFQYKSHILNDNSYNNGITTFFFHGEAYHNNHHSNPSAVSNAEKWFEFDLNKVMVSLLRQR